MKPQYIFTGEGLYLAELKGDRTCKDCDLNNTEYCKNAKCFVRGLKLLYKRNDALLEKVINEGIIEPLTPKEDENNKTEESC